MINQHESHKTFWWKNSLQSINKLTRKSIDRSLKSTCEGFHFS